MSKRHQPHAAALVDEVFPGDSEMATLMRSTDWASMPIGPIDQWSHCLLTVVDICLTSRFPIVLWWGPELTMLYNDAYRPILGATKHPVGLGRPGIETWSEIWDIIGPMLTSVLERGVATWSDDQLLLIDRYGYVEECYFTFSYSPIRDASQVGGVFTAVTETTERVLGERRLRTLSELAARTAKAQSVDEACRLAAEALSQEPHDIPFAMIYLVDPDHRYATLAGKTASSDRDAVSPETIALDDNPVWPIDKVLGTHAPIFVARVDELFEELPCGGWNRPPMEALLLPIAPSGDRGQEGVLVVGLSPYRRLNDDYRRFLTLVASQISGAMGDAQAYEKERARAEALAELDRAKTVFFSNASHEFRTPLALMLGPLADLLRGDRGALLPDQRVELDVMRRNGLRLLRLVNTLLDFSRIEAGRAMASYVPTDLPAVTVDLASSFRSAVEHAGLRLTVDCVPLPDGVTTYVDVEMWEKVVLNLISNAFKFTFEGEITVGMRTSPDGRSLILTVMNTGIGIPEAELPRLFERFHRIQESRGRTYEGSGIGLALVYEVVKLHGGTIDVDTEVGRGTTFRVVIPTGTAHLPADRIGVPHALPSTAIGATPFVEEALRWLPDIVQVDDVERPEPAPAEPADEVATELDQFEASTLARVLVADDNADMRDYLRRLLSDRYMVETVSDGEAALAVVQSLPPDLVIADVMMPRLDGVGLLRALRSDPETREIPVILLSARSGEDSKVEGIGAGADDYLIKPFSSRELLARVDGHLKLTRARQASAKREQVARAKAESERSRLHELFRQAPVAITVMQEPEHVVVLANPQFAQFSGQRDVVGKAIHDALPEFEGQEMAALLDQVYASGEVASASAIRTRWDRRGDGVVEEGFVDVIVQPLRDPEGVVYGLFQLTVDVTEQVQARQRAEEMATERARLLASERAARTEAEEAVRARDEFLSIAAHELRTPVTSIKAIAQLALRSHDRDRLDAARTERLLRTINLTSDRLASLTNDLLDVSRLQGGQLALQPEQVELVAFLRETLGRYAEQFEEGHVLETTLPDNAVHVAADPSRLEQVFANLLSNAVKYSPEGGVIAVTLTQTGDGVMIDVTDAGIGFPEDSAELIFEPFSRASNAALQNLPGMGLGLYISRRIVDLHGGSLWAESNGEGQGTTMHLRLPAIRAERLPSPCA